MDGHEHRGELSEFVDLAAYRQEGGGCGCSKSEPSSARRIRPEANSARLTERCGSAGVEDKVAGLCPRTLSALLDLESEIESVDEFEDDERPRPGQPTLRIVHGLESVNRTHLQPGFDHDLLDLGRMPPIEMVPMVKVGHALSDHFEGGMGADDLEAPDTFWWECPEDPDFEYNAEDMRRCKVGLCRCSGKELEGVKVPFHLAYQVIRSAEVEMKFWYDRLDSHPASVRLFWRARKKPLVAMGTLEHWFGTADAGDDFEERFRAVFETIRAWSYRFRHGFYGVHLPVYIKCRGDKHTNWPARHLNLNVITLAAGYFEKNPTSRAITLLHEMGHLSRSGLFPWLFPLPVGFSLGLGTALRLGPRDRRNDVCHSVSIVEDSRKCYRTSQDEMEPDEWLFGPNPEALVELFQAGDDEGRRDMLDNIDNYVCYMWNRWVDRGYCSLRSY